MQQLILWGRACYRGALLLFKSTLECAVHGGGSIVIQHGLNLSTMCTGSGVSGGVRSTSPWALPKSTCHELQRYLQMAATSSELAGTQERPSCKPSLAAPTAQPKAT